MIGDKMILVRKPISKYNGHFKFIRNGNAIIA